MNRKIALFIFIILLLPNSALAENPILEINVSIKTYEYADAFVVGDFFYYEIILNNPTDKKISDEFSISIYNPHDVLATRDEVEISIEPGEFHKIVAISGHNNETNETAAFPFEIAGDYKIVFESNQSIDFRRLFRVRGDDKIIHRYVRLSNKFEYYFDVMPKWQYNFWKEEEKISKQSIDLNKKMLEATKDMNTATNTIKWATYIMVFVSIMTLIAARKR